MLQKIRASAQGIFGKIITGLIIVTLSLFGFGAFTSFVFDEPKVAVVNGEDIFASQLEAEMDNLRRFLETQDNDSSTISDAMLAESALESLVERVLLTQTANAIGLGIGSQMLDRIIVENEAFQQDGHFDPELFTSILQSAGYTPANYRSALSRERVHDQMIRGIGVSEFVTDWEMHNTIRLGDEKRDIAWLRFTVDDLSVDIDIEDERIASYYTANQENFITERQVVVEYIELSKADFAEDIDITEEDLRKAYEEEKIAYQTREQRRAAHILLQTDADRSEAQAYDKLQEIRTRLAEGEPFDEVAREYSQDPGSAQSGGDLGFASRGVYVPEFEEALWNLQPGMISEPVKTTFGLHLIKLQEIRATPVPAFADLRTTLEGRLQEQKATERYLDAKRQLNALSYEAEDLAQPAATLGLEIRTSMPFAVTGTESGLFSHPQITAAAFSDDVLDGYNSPVLELETGQVVVLHVAELIEARQLQADEVADRIRSHLIQQDARAEASTRANEAATAMRAGEHSRALAAKYRLQWERQEAAPRREASIPEKILETAFMLPHPAEGENSIGVAEDDFGAAVVVVTATHPGDINTLPESTLDSILQINENLWRESALAAFRESLLATANIDR